MINDKPKHQTNTPEANSPIPPQGGSETTSNIEDADPKTSIFKEYKEKVFEFTRKVGGFLENWSIPILTILLVVGNFQLAHYTGKMQDSADSTYALTKAAARTQQEFTMMDVRAYIAVDSIKFEFNFSPDSFIVFWRISNIGKTPAFHMLAVARTTSANGHPTETCESLDRYLPSFGFTLLPGQTVWQTRMVPRHKAFIRSIRLGQDKFLFFGNVVYYDIFNQLHHTHVGVFWNRITNSKDFWNYYNDAD